MSIDPKPRIQVDFKTVMFIMAFFGIGTWGTLWVTVRKAAWWVVEPPMRAAVASIIPQERARTDSVLKAGVDSLRAENRANFKKLREVVEELPGGKAAAKRVRQREQESRRDFGAIMAPQDIVIF